MSNGSAARSRERTPSGFRKSAPSSTTSRNGREAPANAAAGGLIVAEGRRYWAGRERRVHNTRGGSAEGDHPDEVGGKAGCREEEFEGAHDMLRKIVRGTLLSAGTTVDRGRAFLPVSPYLWITVAAWHQGPSRAQQVASR
jgi:hypothetical protein